MMIYTKPQIQLWINYETKDGKDGCFYVFGYSQ